jgi:hypothetical protein
MSKQNLRHLFVVVLAAVVLVVVIAQPLAAKDNTGEIEVKGTVVSINAAGGTFQVQEKDGSIHTIVATSNFDFTSLKVGDTVEVKGTLNADGSVAALSIKIEQAGDKSLSYYCTQTEVQHPVGARLATQYEMPYATLQGWFCEGFGWGQIKHALRTAKLTDGDAADLLQMRRDGMGWGRIWQGLNLIGRSRQDPPSDSEGVVPLTSRPGKSDDEGKGQACGCRPVRWDKGERQA